MRPHATLLIALALALAPAHAATLYRWMDPAGSINYGHRPPANALHVKVLDPRESTVSIVPGMSRQELDRLMALDRLHRLERLEREVADLRARTPTTIVVTPVVDDGPRYAVVPSARRPYGGRPHPDYAR